MEPIWYKSYPVEISRQVSVPEDLTLVSLLDKACQRYRHKTALSCLGSDITFEQVDRLATRFAGYLQSIGAKPGDRAAILLPNILQFPIVFLGILRAGLISTQINPLYTSREILTQLADSQPKVVIALDLVAHELEKALEAFPVSHVVLTSLGDQLPLFKGVLLWGKLRMEGQWVSHRLKYISFRKALAIGESHGMQNPGLKSDDIAVLQYTGGTTGTPKAAMLSHRNLVANILQLLEWSKTMEIDANETVLTALPLYHIFSLSVNFLAFFSIGCRMVLVPRPHPVKNIVAAFKHYPITVMTGVNTLYRSLATSKAFREEVNFCLKIALAGGAPLQTEVNNAFQNVTGVRIHEGYGLTEASPVTHCNPIYAADADGSCGLPLPSTMAKVVDDKGLEVSLGESGELWVKGPQVMKGYWRNPKETEQVLDAEGWLRTGDIATVDADGFFYIVDRLKDMILVSGFNVYPSEIEEVLKEHEWVMDAAVIGEKGRSGSETVHAFVVAADPRLTVLDLRNFCSQSLSGYKRPRYFHFVDELPKSEIGKLLRRELRKQINSAPP